MRLSTEPDRNEAHAIEVIHAALDGGVTFLDTADAYCQDATETGHNERLIARALKTWNGNRSRVIVATKGGLTRPQGGWIADGRARHLAAACEASLRALEVERIPLYQLHAIDPRTPLPTSVRTLESLRRDGLIDHIGLCNVNVGQIEEARRITDIATVQVELSVWHDHSLLNGVAAYCLSNDIRLIAHRPLGGRQRRRRTLSDPLLSDLAARHAATPFDIALAWLRDLSATIVPIPGPTRVETAAASSRALTVRFDDQERARLDERFPAARLVRRPPLLRPAQDMREDGEMVLIMGLPGAGKSTLARPFVDRGYARLNRDEDGGSLRALLPSLDRLIEQGQSKIVLDNTYASRRSRAEVVQAMAGHRLPVRCVWLTTSIEDAQVNAAWRMASKYGRMLEPGEIRRAAKRDANMFGPTVQFRYQRELEPPTDSEGFSQIDIVPFERRWDPRLVNRAALFWCDGVLRRSRSGRRSPSSPEDVEVLPSRGEVLRRYAAAGWRLLGLSWHPEIADEKTTARVVEAGFARMEDLLGVSIDVLYCPHAAGPPVCWCRKPLPGLGVVCIQRYQLDPAQCLYVGSGPQDPGFARRLGFQYRDAEDFFSCSAPP